MFDPETSSLYRVEKESKMVGMECQDWIKSKYLKEEKVQSQVFELFEAVMEKCIREYILKEKKFL